MLEIGKISIVMPTFNRGYLLHHTIKSILCQSYSNWELIIIDDGSTDNTESIVSSYDESRIFYYFQKNQGPATARNLGMQYATGKIITFIDSDDPVYSFYLEKIIHCFENASIFFALCHCDMFYELYDRSGNLLARKSAEKDQSNQITIDDLFHWRKRVAIGTGLSLRKDMLKHNVSWNTDIFPGDDIEFVLQLAELAPSGFHYITLALFEYRQKYGGDGICSNTSYQQWAKMFEDIYHLHKNSPLLTDHDQYIKRIKKYFEKQLAFEQGQEVAPQFKYFPEWSDLDG